MGILDFVLGPKVAEVKLPMEAIICKEHGTKIVIHKNDQETLFNDNNDKTVVIFTAKNGTRYLKRYMINGCNLSCSTVQKLLGVKTCEN